MPGGGTRSGKHVQREPASPEGQAAEVGRGQITQASGSLRRSFHLPVWPVDDFSSEYRVFCTSERSDVRELSETLHCFLRVMLRLLVGTWPEHLKELSFSPRSSIFHSRPRAITLSASTSPWIRWE